MKCFLKRTSRPGFASFTPRCMYVYRIRRQNQMAENLFFALLSRILYCYILTQTYNMYTSNTNKPQQFQQNFSQPHPRHIIIVLKTLSQRVLWMKKII